MRSWWGEAVELFLLCLKQHAADRRLTSKLGFHNGEIWGCTELPPDQLEEVSNAVTCVMEPHPQFLGGCSPRYWVCAYANRQVRTPCTELPSLMVRSTTSKPKSQRTSNRLRFTGVCLSLNAPQCWCRRAMQMSRGTVSVVDSGGVSWSRIWCVSWCVYADGVEGACLSCTTRS